MYYYQRANWRQETCILKKKCKGLHSLHFRQNLKKVPQNTDVISGYILTWSCGGFFMSCDSALLLKWKLPLHTKSFHSAKKVVIQTLRFVLQQLQHVCSPFPLRTTLASLEEKHHGYMVVHKPQTENCSYRWWYISCVYPPQIMISEVVGTKKKIQPNKKK